MTREELVAAIKRCAERLGRAPTFSELRNEVNVTSREMRKRFGNWSAALRDCGLHGGGCGYKASLDELFRDWAQVVRSLGKVPSMAEYDMRSRFSVKPLQHRYGIWRNVAVAMQRYAVQQRLEDQYGDVLEVITSHRERTAPAEERSSAGAKTFWQAKIRDDRPVYGEPLLNAGLTYAPSNEGAVIFLFGMLAKELGFAVTRFQKEFPDCEALCRVQAGKWQKVRIEFEYASSHFLDHNHDADGCDIIVCWVNDWPDCPLEVIELRNEIGRLFDREKR